MPRSTDCPKCQGKMGDGVIVDRGYGQSFISHWLPALIKVSRWFGLKVRKKDVIPTVTLRCTRCGILESYAPPAA